MPQPCCIDEYRHTDRNNDSTSVIRHDTRGDSNEQTEQNKKKQNNDMREETVYHTFYSQEPQKCFLSTNWLIRANFMLFGTRSLQFVLYLFGRFAAPSCHVAWSLFPPLCFKENILNLHPGRCPCKSNHCKKRKLRTLHEYLHHAIPCREHAIKELGHTLAHLHNCFPGSCA